MAKGDTQAIEEFGKDLIGAVISLQGVSFVTKLLERTFPQKEVFIDKREGIKIQERNVKENMRKLFTVLVDRNVYDFGYKSSEIILRNIYRKLEKKYHDSDQLLDVLNFLPEKSLEEERLQILPRRKLEERVLERTKELEDLNASLEKRVLDRTKELAVANEKLEKSNEHLKKLSKAKSEFLSMTSHQLLTPLTAIKWGLSEMQEVAIVPQEKIKELLSSLDPVIVTTNRLILLVTNLLNLSRIEEERFTYQIERILIGDVVGDAVSTLQTAAHNCQITLDYRKPHDKIIVFADRPKMYLVAENIIDNAIKYSYKNKNATVEIRITKGDHDVTVSVKDDGIGIPQNDQPKIFRRFFRANNAAKMSVLGSGLGLYIVKKIVTDHGGELYFESRENNGSTFFIKLPLASYAEKGSVEKGSGPFS